MLVKHQWPQTSMKICSLSQEDKQRGRKEREKGNGQGTASFWVADTSPAAAGFWGATTLSFCIAEAFAVETEAEGSPWGFWSVITSSLRIAKNKCTALRNGNEHTS
jgi:hypothetical protein